MYVNEPSFPPPRSDTTPDRRPAHSGGLFRSIIQCLVVTKRWSRKFHAMLVAPSLRLAQPKHWFVTSSCRWGSALLAVTTTLSPNPVTAKEYEFSYEPYGVDIQGNGWSGHHFFQDVYCVDFPDRGSVSSLEEGLLKGGAISYFLAVYPGPTAAYIVTSTIPNGRSETEEVSLLLANEQHGMRVINAVPPGNRYLVDTRQSLWGTTIRLQLSDIVEDPPEGPFPLVRYFNLGEGAKQRLRSAHRIFVKGSNRFEIAVLGAVDATDSAEVEIALKARIGKLADQLTDSLQQCELDSRH